MGDDARKLISRYCGYDIIKIVVDCLTFRGFCRVNLNLCPLSQRPDYLRLNRKLQPSDVNHERRTCLLASRI